MIKKIFLDTETCGLTGPVILIQYAIDDGPIVLVDIWYKTVQEIIELIESFVQPDVCIVGFNLTFDWFHLYKLWTILQLINTKNARMIDILDKYIIKEKLGRDCVSCLKPYHIFDIFLWARKTKYQSLMDRKDIRIKKVPTILAYRLVNELEKRVRLPDIYFARKKKDREIQWKVEDFKTASGISPDFKNIVLRFAASSALKVLAADALELDPEDILYFADAGLPRQSMPFELEYAPFWEAVTSEKHKYNTWPHKIQYHITHWKNFDLARKYAAKDVELTRSLYYWFLKQEQKQSEQLIDDDDSILAALVAVVRWKGLKVNIPAIKEKIRKLKAMVGGDNDSNEYNPNHVPTYAKKVQAYLASSMNDIERPIFLSKDSTKKIILKELATWRNDDGSIHPVAIKAKKVLEARLAKYLINLLAKLVRAGRLHPDLKVIGTLSGRMSGSAKFNITGIPRTKEYRKLFTFLDPSKSDQDYTVAIGDYSSLEVAIAAASYGDEELTNDLLLCYKCKYKYKLDELLVESCPACGLKDSRQKVHGLMGMQMYPGNNYEQVLMSKGTINDMYSVAKNCVFTLVYGGDYHTLVNRYEIPEEVAKEGERRFLHKYKGVAKARKKVFDQFCSMKQIGGIGTAVIWHTPADKIESMLGFPRYFTLENQICEALFKLANDPPKEWRELRIQVVRRDRVQLVGGAVQSALFATAFNIQSQSMRAAANHVIQATGAGVTKRLQVGLWDELQPAGINEWNIVLFQVHDEIVSPIKKTLTNKYEQIVKRVVESFRSIIPLLAFDYKIGVKDWSEK